MSSSSKAHQTGHLKCVYFTMCKIYLNFQSFCKKAAIQSTCKVTAKHHFLIQTTTSFSHHYIHERYISHLQSLLQNSHVPPLKKKNTAQQCEWLMYLRLFNYTLKNGFDSKFHVMCSVQFSRSVMSDSLCVFYHN